MPEETAPQVQETVEQDIITQETEETVAIKPKAEPKKGGSRRNRRRRKLKKRKKADGSGKSRTGTQGSRGNTPVRGAGAFGKGAQMGRKGTLKEKVFEEVPREMLRQEPLRGREDTARLTWADVLWRGRIAASGI